MVWPSEYVDGPRPFNRCVTPPTRGDWVGGLSKVGGSVGLGPQLGMGQPNPAGGQLGRKCLRGFCLILGDFGWVVGITPRGGCGWVVGFFQKKKVGQWAGFGPGKSTHPQQLTASVGEVVHISCLAPHSGSSPVTRRPGPTSSSSSVTA